MSENGTGFDQQNDIGATRPTERLARPDGVILTPPQREAKSTITASLADRTKGPRIIVLEGLSGMGKSTVLNQMRPQISQSEALFVDGTRIRINCRELAGDHQGSVVVDTVPYETDQAIENIQGTLPNLTEVEKIVLRGMTNQEATDYITRISSANIPDLSMDEILRYSMGVPLLIEQMLLPGMTRDAAEAICKRYLWANFADPETIQLDLSSAGKYLGLEPPPKIAGSLKDRDRSNMDETDIYEGLTYVLARWENLKSGGIQEEPPLFVATESHGIYNSMLRVKGRSANTTLQIFAPELSEEDLQRAQQAFAPNTIVKGGRVPGARGIGTRHDMFISATDISVYRKSHILLRDGDIGYADDYTARQGGDYNEAEMREDFEEGKFGIRPSESKDIRRSLYLGCYEHGGMMPYLTVPGWMVESFLQQRGIAYVARNGLINKSYRFDPEAKKIIFED